MIKWYKNLNDTAKMFFILCLIASFGALVFIPFCATSLLSWDWEFGFLLGSAIEAVSLWFLVLSTEKMSKQTSKIVDTVIVVLLYFARFLLYLGGLLLAALLTYVAQIYVFNLFAVFIAYMPIQIVVLVIQGKKKGEACKKE